MGTHPLLPVAGNRGLFCRTVLTTVRMIHLPAGRYGLVMLYLKNTNIMSKKELYAAPETEVLELRLEGVIAISQPEEQDINW